jgi:NADPH-dependent 2,4-dienoyl-CoA reductase/sulfur reductase-like enzyme
LHLGSRPQQITGDGRVQRVILSDGTTIPCDFLVVAVGIQPNKEILRGTPITAEKAILVNEHCETNVPGIFAAGDCAAILDPLFGKHRLIDHWENALITGAIAGGNMAGDSVFYEAVNHFRCNAFDLQMVGWGESRLVDRRHIRGNVSSDSLNFAEIGVAADGRIAQILAIGEAGDHRTFEALVKQRARVDGNEEAVKDPTEPLAQFLT